MSITQETDIKIKEDSDEKLFASCPDCGYESPHYNLFRNAVSSRRGHYIGHTTGDAHGMAQ